MTREEFKKRWESGEDGGGITFDEVAKCAKDWGLLANPLCHQIDKVVSMVCNAAGVKED